MIQPSSSSTPRLPRPTRAASPVAKRERRVSTVPDSLRSSLDELLAVEVARVQEEQAARVARQRAEQRLREEERLNREADAERARQAQQDAHFAELLRRAQEEAQIEATRQHVLREAREAALRRAAESRRVRVLRHESRLRAAQAEPAGRLLRRALAATLLGIATTAAAYGFGTGQVQRTLEAETTALLQKKSQTEAEARAEVARLETLLRSKQTIASVETSQLEAELAAAHRSLADLRGTTQESRATPRPVRPAQASTKQPAAPSHTPSPATVAKVEDTWQACNAYDPMCGAL